MWNSFRTDGHQGMVAGTTTYAGGGGDRIHAYVARPEGPGPFPGLVLVHHMPGWDEFYLEFTRRFAAHGYVAMCPDLYCRVGHGSPDDVAAAVRAQGGVADDAVVADLAAARDWVKSLPTSNGKVGIVGTCSGGRHAVLTASRAPGFDAVIDLWGGGVVATPEQLTPNRPVAPIDYTKDLNLPLLGIFGNDDQSPPPDQVNLHEEALKRHGKTYEFHRYDGAGHGFFYYDRPAYRAQQAMDAWAKVFDFLGRTLS
ncbi:MAG: dienelactone hydrolase family protein [Chloroflexota bacterium]|nr:MAG: dienelactone hydrolase family protein [Chloroflexota bacterium]